MFRSATFKLTMWYLVIIVAISLLFSVVLYNVATTELVRGLHSETRRIFTQFPVFQNSPYLQPIKDINDAAHRLLLRLIGFNLLVFVTAGLASYLLAKRTLSPIEQAHAQQQRFTADVSHELRTPLTALRMESEVALLNEYATALELRQTLASNLEEVTKLEALINNLLRLTHLEESELRHSFESVSLSQVVGEAVAQVSTHATSRHIKIDTNISDIIVYGDHDSLVQLIVILVDNAIKYSPKNATVSINTKVDGKQLLLGVVDSGTGIEPEALKHIFERFYRADSSRNKTDTEGYGLGLSIAKMIADIHQAEIILTSKQGSGTTATLQLPLARN